MGYEESRKEFDNPTFRNRIKEYLSHKCCNCGSKKNIEYHHIVPLKLGGTNTLTNIVPLCHKCHKAAHCGQHMSHYSDKTNSGRKSKSNVEEHSEIFDMFINGEIGNRKCQELLGYSHRSTIKSRPEFKRYISKNGILSVRNLIDVASTNRREPLKDVDIVGEIEYIDGRKSPIIYKNTRANNIKYHKKERRSEKDEAFELWKLMQKRKVI